MAIIFNNGNNSSGGSGLDPQTAVNTTDIATNTSNISTNSAAIEATGHNISLNGANTLELQDSEGSVLGTVDLTPFAADVMLTSSSFDVSTNILTLTLSDNNVIPVDLSSLGNVNVVSGSILGRWLSLFLNDTAGTEIQIDLTNLSDSPQVLTNTNNIAIVFGNAANNLNAINALADVASTGSFNDLIDVPDSDGLAVSDQFSISDNNALVLVGTEYEPIELSGEITRVLENITQTDLLSWTQTQMVGNIQERNGLGELDGEGNSTWLLNGGQIIDLLDSNLSNSVNALDASRTYEITYYLNKSSGSTAFMGVTNNDVDPDLDSDVITLNQTTGIVTRTTTSASPLFDSYIVEDQTDNFKITLTGVIITPAVTHALLEPVAGTPFVSRPYIGGRLQQVIESTASQMGAKYTARYLVDRSITTLQPNSFTNVNLDPASTVLTPSTAVPSFTISTSTINFTREAVVAGYFNFRLRNTTVGTTGDLQMTVTHRDANNQIVATFRGEQSDAYVNGDRINLYAFVQPGDRFIVQGFQTTATARDIDFSDMVLWVEEI